MPAESLPIPNVLNFIGFVATDGTPTQRWKSFRDRERAPYVLGQAIREAYHDLFEMYPDAYRKDDEALRNFFRVHTDLGDDTMSRMVTTFKVLCELASFDHNDDELSGGSSELSTASSNGVQGAGPAAAAQTPPPVTALPQQAGQLTVNLNIQLQLPATQDAEVYERLFEALKRHLLVR